MLPPAVHALRQVVGAIRAVQQVFVDVKGVLVNLHHRLRRLHGGGIGRRLDDCRAAIAREAPFRHRHGGNKIVAVDQIKNGVVPLRGGLRIGRGEGGGKRVGKDRLAVVDQIRRKDVADGRSARMAGDPVDELCLRHLLKLRTDVCIDIAFDISQDARRRHVKAAVVRLARPVRIALAR